MDGDAEVEAAVFEVSDDDESTPTPPDTPPPRKKVSRRAAATSRKHYDLNDTIGLNLTELVAEGGDDEDDELGFDDYESDDAFDAIPEEDDEDDDDDERAESDPGTSEDEDILPSHHKPKPKPKPKKPSPSNPAPRDEMSRDTMAVRNQAVAPRDPIKLLRSGDVEPIELPLKYVIANGTVRSKFRPKEAKLSDLALIMVNDDDAVHALGVLNTRTNDLTYHELSFAEEQALIRAGLSTLFNKINYGQLCTEQERWDEMTDGETADAKLPRKYEGLFPVHTVPMTKRRRAFLVSSLFCRTRKEKLDASKKKREAKKETVPDDDDSRKSPTLLAGDPDDDEVRAAAKPSRVEASPKKQLKITSNRSVNTDGTSTKNALSRKQAELKAQIKARAPKQPPPPPPPKKKPDQASSGLFSFVSKGSPDKPKRKDQPPPEKKKPVAVPSPVKIKPKKPAPAPEPMEVEDTTSKKKKKPVDEGAEAATPKRPIVVDEDDAPRAPKRTKADHPPPVRRRLDDAAYDGTNPAAAASLPFMAPGTGLCFMVYPATAAQMSDAARVFTGSA